MPPVPKHIVTHAFHHALGKVRQMSAEKADPKEEQVPGKEGVAPRDLIKVCAVVIGEAQGAWRRILLRPADVDPAVAWGDKAATQKAVDEATGLAMKAWSTYEADNDHETSSEHPSDPAPGGAVLVPDWSKRASGGKNRKPRAAIGVVVPKLATDMTPVGVGAAAEKAKNEGKKVRRKARSEGSGPKAMLFPEAILPHGSIKKMYDPPVAAAATDDAETMFEQYRGAIVWIDDEGENETVYDFNGVRTWEIDIARTRAAGALAAGAGSEPYGGKVLFNGTHGAVGVYSQASSGSSSAGTIVEFVQDEYEANA